MSINREKTTDVQVGTVALLQEFDRTLGQVGPFAPLFQPAVPYAYRSNVQGVAYHSVWAIDFIRFGRPV